jgi:hypothetical protein
MKKVQVIAPKNLPARLPFFHTIYLSVILKLADAPGWAWGAIGTLLFISWAVAISKRIVQTEIDIFEEDPEKMEKKAFADRLVDHLQKEKK